MTEAIKDSLTGTAEIGLLGLNPEDEELPLLVDRCRYIPNSWYVICFTFDLVKLRPCLGAVLAVLKSWIAYV